MKKILLLTLLFLFFPPPLFAQNVANTKFGIFYALWHCPIVGTGPNYYIRGALGIPDVTEILAGNQTQINSPGRDRFGWAPVGFMHYWGKPELGYYCLVESETVLREHAKLLYDMGIDFIFVDSTNSQRVNKTSKEWITNSFDKLLQVWSTIPNSPKIVVWVPVTDWIAPSDTQTMTSDSKMVDYLTGKLNQYPNLRFIYQGKPLLLVVDSGNFMSDEYMAINETELLRLSNTHTTRRMWNLEPKIDPDHWSAGQPCSNAVEFRTSGGNRTCNQAVSTYNGTIEQISITTAYQSVFMSDVRTSTPKFYGKTLQKQFQTVFNNPGVPIVTIYGWNEFIAQRFCLATNGWGGSTDPSYCNDQNDHIINPGGVGDGNRYFVDSYDQNYNKDIEPAEDDCSDLYYKITKACIALYKSGGKCDNNHISDLCCTIPTFIHGWVNDPQCIDKSNWNISGMATDDRNINISLTVRAEIYPDNEPFNKLSFSTVANLGPEKKWYGINIPSLPVSFKDKKIRVHVFGVGPDAEMELNMLKVPNNIFGPCNNLIPSLVPTATPTATPTKTPTATPTKTPTATPTIIKSLCTQCSNLPLAKGYADADCSGITTINDISIWRAEFILGKLGAIVETNWQADFDCDGKVTLNDASIWRENFIKAL